MKIIVCTKQIQHIYTRTGMSPESTYINPEDGVYRVNPYDEAALELALRLKDKHAGITVDLLTLGPLVAPDEIRHCLATGADQLYRINVAEPSGPLRGPLDQPDPWVKSALLARAVRQIGGDLVLCGKMSLDKGNGQVAAFLARRLERPFVSAITDLNVDQSGAILTVQRSAGRGVREEIECRLPVVLSVDLSADLRLPKYAERQQAETYVPQPLDYTADPTAPKMVCQHRYQPRPRPKLVAAPDSRQHAYNRIMQLLTGSTVEKTGQMLTGDPATQVEGILTFLETHGFLQTTHSGS